MIALQTAPATKQAAITRLALTAVCGPAIALIGIGFAGANIFLLATAVPPLYLLWVFIVDLVAVVRSLFGPVQYADRPRYRWLFGAGLLLFTLWAALQLTPLSRFIGVK